MPATPSGNQQDASTELPASNNTNRNWLRGDLNLRNHVIDFVGPKAKTWQSIEIARFLSSILVAGIGFEPMTFRL